MVMSNYCLMTLLIFYLQNLEQPMLDSIRNNQALCKPIFLDGKPHWNVAFNDGINLTRQNQQSVRQLFEGFFEFYCKINFANYIVSIYSGSFIKREDFDKHPDYENYRNIIQPNLLPLQFKNPEQFVVQDGFELNVNVGTKDKGKVLILFDSIKATHMKCLELKDAPFSVLITKIFTDVQLPPAQRKMKEKTKFTMTMHQTTSDLKLCQSILNAESNNKIHGVMDQQKLFYEIVVIGTIRFLQEIYLCTIDAYQNQSISNSMVKRFKVSLRADTFNGRKKINFKDQASVDNEMDLSKQLSQRKLLIDLDLTISSKTGGKSIDFEMVDNVIQKKALQIFSNYFSVNIVQAVNFYLRKRLEKAIIPTYSL